MLESISNGIISLWIRRRIGGYKAEWLFISHQVDYISSGGDEEKLHEDKVESLIFDAEE